MARRAGGRWLLLVLALASCFALADAKKKSRPTKEPAGGPVRQEKDPDDPNQAHLSYGNNPVPSSSALLVHSNCLEARDDSYML
jgi:hypothetical protein